jgi:hypothetical protein
VATEAASGKGAGHRYMVGAQIVEVAPHQVCRHQTVAAAVVVGGGEAPPFPTVGDELPPYVIVGQLL